MSWTYELMYLPGRHAGSYVLVTSRGASVALRIYVDGVTDPRRIDGRDLPGLPGLYAEARAAGKPILPQDEEAIGNAGEWARRISRANERHGLPALGGRVGADRAPTPVTAPSPLKTAPAPAISRTVFESIDGTPLRSLADWQALHSARHWKAGHSAMEMARAWHHAQAFPPAVAEVLARGPFGTLVVERGIAECLTEVPGAGRPSHTDLMVEARGPAGRVVIGVEAKVREAFGPRVDAWLNKEEPGRPRSNKELRLRGLCAELGLGPEAATTLALRYQLLHRSWAALAHAKETGARAAVLLVHSLADGEDEDNLADYRAFTRALGFVAADLTAPMYLGVRGGLPFWGAWVCDRPLPA